jgi:FkbM family methyltransferase
MIKKIIKSLALLAHIQHDRAYSYYKIREAGVQSEFPLNAEERDFYLSLCSALQDRNMVIYDIGAANGSTARCFAKLRNVVSVHAFEPIPKSYQNLLSVSHEFQKINCHNTALGNTKGQQTIYINNLINSSSLLSPTQLFQGEIQGIEVKEQIEIPIVQLDEYVRDRYLPSPHLIKIDVQGYEKEVITGGHKTIKQAKYCFMEMSFQSLYEGSSLFEELYQLMVDMGFRLVGVSSPMRGKSGSCLQVDGLFLNKNVRSLI